MEPIAHSPLSSYHVDGARQRGRRAVDGGVDPVRPREGRPIRGRERHAAAAIRALGRGRPRAAAAAAAMAQRDDFGGGSAGGRVRSERLRGLREDARRSGQRGAANQRPAARRRRCGRRQEWRARRQAAAVGPAAPVRRAARQV